MKLLVCGGRNYNDDKRAFAEMDKLHAVSPIAVVIHGACMQRGMLSGADRWAEAWAICREVAYVGVPAKWERDGRAAGPRRNQAMIDDWEPDAVLAFPGGKGTADMVRRAKAFGIKVIEI